MIYTFDVSPWDAVARQMIETDTSFLDLTAVLISNPRWSDAINAGFRYEKREDRQALALFALMLAELEEDDRRREKMDALTAPTVTTTTTPHGGETVLYRYTPAPKPPPPPPPPPVTDPPVLTFRQRVAALLFRLATRLDP